MAIGLICAIPQELDALQRVLQDTDTEAVAHTRFTTGILDGHDVVLAGSGMGKVNAALVATVLADRFHCPAIVFSDFTTFVDQASATSAMILRRLLPVI